MRVIAVLTLFCAAPVLAHGGGYRGAWAPGPASPGSTPITILPGAAGAAGAGTAASGARDLGRWQAWWEFNKDAYLQVKVSVVATRAATSQLSVAQIDREIVPVLTSALRTSRQPDLASACLIALGKIAPDPETSGVRDVFVAALRGGVQETRETAALAMGITRRPWVVDDLLGLATDDGKGRRLLDRSRVDERTRAFAVYGLGLVAERCDDMALRARIIDALRTVLQRVDRQDLDLALATVHGLRLACPSPRTRTLESWTLTQQVVDTLWTYARRRGRATEESTQAHAALAVARILADDDSGAAAKYIDPLIDELREPDGRRGAVAQSAAIAMGFLARPTDTEACAALRRLAERGTDRQARWFALVALGQIGGDDNRGFLLKTLANGHKVTVKPWAALALGVMRYQARKSSGTQASEDATVGRALRDALMNVAAAEPRGAFAIALGLANYVEAAPDLKALLVENDRQDEFAGYLALALALMNDKSALPLLNEVAKRSLRRPQLLRQLATAAGMMGDRNAAAQLLDLLRGSDLSVATLGAVAGALGQIGDGTSLDALAKVVRDDHTPDLARAFAAAAIGGIADDDVLPWNAGLACGVNYASARPSLTDGFGGVLDIL